MNASCKSRIQQKLKIFKRRRFPRFPAESQILVEKIEHWAKPFQRVAYQTTTLLFEFISKQILHGWVLFVD